MHVKEAATLFRYYQQSHHRKRTIDSYQTLLSTFDRLFAERSLDSLQSDEVYQFLETPPKVRPNLPGNYAMPS